MGDHRRGGPIDKEIGLVETNRQADSALAAMDKTVMDALAYFEGPGFTSKPSVGAWGAWETLCHFLFLHEVAIEGMKSVARGGGPYQMDAAADELNARAIAKHEGASIPDLIDHLRELETQLCQAAHNLPNLDAPVILRVDGTSLTGRQRIERIDWHWAQHMAELRAAELS